MECRHCKVSAWLCCLKEQSPTGMLGDPLKQVVDRLEGIPGEKQRKLMKV